MINALVLLICLLGSPVFAESLSFEVDDKGQTYSEIRLYMANIPRDFDLSAPPIYVGQAKRFTVSNLVVGQTYKFAAVLAWTGPGAPFQSELSNVVQQRIVADPVTPPPAPLPTPTVTAEAIEKGAVLTFSIADGVVPTRYLVKLVADPGIPDTNVGTLYEGTVNPFKITGLKDGTKYNFYVRYNVGDAVSPRSVISSVTTPTVIILQAPGLLIIKTE